MSDIQTRKMLDKMRSCIRESKQKPELPDSGILTEDDNMLRRFHILMEEQEVQPIKGNSTSFTVSANDVQFGSVRASMEDAVRKTVGDIVMRDDGLKYYTELDDLVLNGEVPGLGVTFQFRYKDPSGEGCYVWCEGLQMTDANARTIEKIRDAFLNWKQSLIDDGDLMAKLKKEATKE